jgi:hypothetical protein
VEASMSSSSSSSSSLSSSLSSPTPPIAAPVQTIEPELENAGATTPDGPAQGSTTSPPRRGSHNRDTDSDSDSSDQAAKASTRLDTPPQQPPKRSTPILPAPTVSEPVSSVAAPKSRDVEGSTTSASEATSAPSLGGPQSAPPAGRRAFRPSYALSDSSSDD